MAPYDPQQVRARLLAVASAEGLTPNAWSAKAALPESTLRNFLKGASTDPQLSTLLALAAAVGRSLGDLLGEPAPAGRLRLAGQVRAGGEIVMLNDDAALGDVPLPPGADAGTMAVAVRGASMEPVYHDGDVLYFRRADAVDEVACLDRECVVKLANDGAEMVKVLRRGIRAGRYNLESYNIEGGYLTLPDRALDWAAPIEFTDRRAARPVRRMPPARRTPEDLDALERDAWAAKHNLDGVVPGTVERRAGSAMPPVVVFSASADAAHARRAKAAKPPGKR